MSALRIGELFAGYGGLGMGVQRAIGGEIAWYSDVCKFDKNGNAGHYEPHHAPCSILAHRFPDVPNHGDITKIEWSTVEPVDVLTGGFPCQDVSSSGRKAGVDVGAKSGLWREMARAIGELRPSLVVVENVRDLLTRGIGRVLGDLADLGYDAQWTTVSACSIGAPFARVRLFITATPAGTNGAGLGWLPEQNGVSQQAIQASRDWTHADRLAVGDERLLDRWAAVIGRPAPDPYDVGINGQPRLTPAFEEWLMGLPAGWVTDVPGITRNEALKALGNGVVPQQAEAALRFLLGAQAVAA